MTDAWGALGNAYHKLGRTEDAIAALLEEDRARSGDPVTLASLANEYLDLGDMKSARLFADRAIAIKGPEQAHEVLAEIDIEEGKIDDAEKEARLALGGHWGKEKPNMILAQVTRARGDLPGALKQLDAIAARRQAAGDSVISNLHFQRGDLLARMGRTAEAEGEFREEMKRFPNNAAAWSSLAFLYASQGRAEEARRTLAEMVRVSPMPKTYRAAAKSWGILGDKPQSEYWARRASQAHPPGVD
jgi:protein O-GlcNAc transferase